MVKHLAPFERSERGRHSRLVPITEGRSRRRQRNSSPRAMIPVFPLLAGLALGPLAGAASSGFERPVEALERDSKSARSQGEIKMTDAVVAKSGEEFSIVLEGVPTAGFKWVLAHPFAKAGLVQELGERWEPTSALVGGTARQRFSFRALAAGEILLHFRYGRTWETAAREEREILVKIDP
jgi:predicted secreted protein